MMDLFETVYQILIVCRACAPGAGDEEENETDAALAFRGPDRPPGSRRERTRKCLCPSVLRFSLGSDHNVLDRTSQWGGPSISPPPSTQGWLHVRGTVEVAGGVWEGDVAHLEGALEGHAG